VSTTNLDGRSARNLPRVVIVEEGMREGMQIEDAGIPPADKIRLLDALSDTGLRHIVVGSFVSPKWVPQMAEIETIVQGFTPRPGVTYTALALNQRGVERRAELTPPLSAGDGVGRSLLHLCDVFLQRNTARTIAQERDQLPQLIDTAVAAGVTEAMVGVNAAWGSNWLGRFGLDQRNALIADQVAAWARVGVPTTGVYLGDPMSWNTPGAMEEQIGSIRREWPQVTTIHLHLHNARGCALTSAYVALRALSSAHTLVVDTSVGGMGGCPYCGNGRATKMIPTEDLVDLFEEEGVDTGVDLDRLIEASVLAEQVVGHQLYGHVSKAGPRPRRDRLYAMDMPLVETVEQAQHFRLGPRAYAGSPAPWKAPVTSPARDAVDRATRDELRAPALVTTPGAPGRQHDVV
jgi:hydroxymethylglutaryl-CoA lyase